MEKKCYIVTNPGDVVNTGRCEFIARIYTDKYEVQRDVAAFLYIIGNSSEFFVDNKRVSLCASTKNNINVFL